MAGAFDGVHLSWAGVVTAEGFIADLEDGDVAMLRYWFSERTHWLSDVFGEPTPLTEPVLDPAGTDDVLEASVEPAERRHRDAALLSRLLGR